MDPIFMAAVLFITPALQFVVVDLAWRKTDRQNVEIKDVVSTGAAAHKYCAEDLVGKTNQTKRDLLQTMPCCKVRFDTQ